MSFAEIHQLHLDFKRRLTSIVGKEVFSEITVSPPRATDDELSFLRLISWGYVLVFESGRGPLSFLKNLPPLNQSNGQLIPHLHSLRTWTSHNLDFDKKRDIKTIRAATLWLLEKCGTGSPERHQEWEACFNALAGDLKNLLRNAISACDCFEKHEDREMLIQALNKSLDRNWEAFLFDEYVQKALSKFQYTGIPPIEIRKTNLEAWRRIVSISEDEDSIERNLTLRIENDVLTLMASAFPSTSEEIAEKLQRPSHLSITAAMLFLREKCGDKLENLDSIMRELRAI
ncbi:hypothetical protein [Pseudomonas sp. AE27]|uniref:hypothetical protein n=1 Tax=Pseudomonas sp. AE27 TaxID=3127460 RepID=UPI0030D42306